MSLCCFASSFSNNSIFILFLIILSFVNPLILIISSKLFLRAYTLGAKKTAWSYIPSNFNLPKITELMKEGSIGPSKYKLSVSE